MSEQASLAQGMNELRKLVEEARRRGDIDTTVATLSTVDAEGRPSARGIYVLLSDDLGPIFFVNQNSGKGKQLLDNPNVCLSFYWPHLEHQAVFEGEGRMLSDTASDQFWKTRPRESQLAAWASDQLSETTDERSHRELLAEVKRKFDAGIIPRPAHWVGYQLEPRRLTYWPTGWHRLYPRTLYERLSDGRWQRTRKQP